MKEDTEWTTIAITKPTHAELSKRKLCPRENFNDVVRRECKMDTVVQCTAIAGGPTVVDNINEVSNGI